MEDAMEKNYCDGTKEQIEGLVKKGKKNIMPLLNNGRQEVFEVISPNGEMIAYIVSRFTPANTHARECLRLNAWGHYRVIEIYTKRKTFGVYRYWIPWKK
jgi:hypothetical protein